MDLFFVSNHDIAFYVLVIVNQYCVIVDYRHLIGEKFQYITPKLKFDYTNALNCCEVIDTLNGAIPNLWPIFTVK